MLSVAICVGSSCHLKGSYDVIEAMREEIKKRQLESKIELKAAFCLGKCGYEGVTIKVGDKIITGLTADKVPALFETEILPLLA
jgi:NADH:ubiquinone oxidoreductase subunit E